MKTRSSRTALGVFLRIAFATIDSIAASSQTIVDVLLWRSQPQGRRVVASDDLVECSQLVHLFRSALGSDGSELISILNKFTENRDQIERALIVWLDLIEVLVQTSEKRYGATPGMGKIKTEDVKRALMYLFESGSFSLPNVPRSLATLIVDSVVEWAIDVIVLQENGYDLWETTSVSASAPRRFWQMLKRTGRTLVLKLANLAAMVIDWIRNLLHPRPSLSPALKAALDAVDREAAIVKDQNLIVQCSRLFIWIGTHRATLVNATELVFGAVHEAETVLTMTGPEKKALARSLVWGVLKEMGFAPEPGILRSIIDSAIDLLIETAVHFFNKRGAFQHGLDRAAAVPA